jgi:hypothetical protein
MSDLLTAEVADRIVSGCIPAACLPMIVMTHTADIDLGDLIEMLCMAVAAPTDPDETRPHQPTKADVLRRAEERLTGIVVAWLQADPQGRRFVDEAQEEKEDEASVINEYYARVDQIRRSSAA